MSDLVSKYLAPELPPWQIAIIPSADRYFVLIRMHHLLLSEDGLKLTDLLQLTRHGGHGGHPRRTDFSHLVRVSRRSPHPSYRPRPLREVICTVASIFVRCRPT